MSAALPTLGLAAWSGTGKTTLLCALLPRLRAAGLRVGVVKHAHHDFDIDLPGKDSHALRAAGAAQVLVGSHRRWALIVENEQEREPPLVDVLTRISGSDLDLILVEGMRAGAIPKVELHRPSMQRPLLCSTDPHVIAVASDVPIDGLPPTVARLDLNDVPGIARFIVAFTQRGQDAPTVPGLPS